MHIDGKNYGPFGQEEILNFLEKQEITMAHFVYDIEKKQWAMLADHAPFHFLVPPRPAFPPDIPRYYLLTNNDEVKGPLSKNYIIDALMKKEINPYQFLYFEGQKDWIRIKEAYPFMDNIPRPPLKVPKMSAKKQSQALKKGEGSRSSSLKEVFFKEENEDNEGKEEKVKSPRNEGAQGVKGRTSKGEFEISNEPVWMIVKGEEELGPFRYLEVLKMIQKNVITKNNQIKKVSEETWRRIVDVFEFNTSVIKRMVNSSGKRVEKVFLTRKHKRSPYLGPAKVTYKNKTYSGTCTSISVGGCFIEMRPDEFELNGEASLKIMAGEVSLIIETKGKVVSLNARNPRGIGFSFINLSQELMSEIQKYVNKYGENLRENQ